MVCALPGFLRHGADVRPIVRFHVSPLVLLVAEPAWERGSAFFGRAVMFNFGKPKTAGDWIVHVAGAIVALLLVWWMLRMYVL